MVIDIINLQSAGNEAETIRQCIEYFGFQVRLYPVGRPQDLIDYLKGTSRQIGFTDYIILSAHGDDLGFILPALSLELYKEAEPRSTFLPDHILEYGNLHKECVISTACIAGIDTMAEAFLEANASSYISPNKEIEGNASLIFIQQFFYLLSTSKYSIQEIFERAQDLDDETGAFQIWRQGV